MTFEDWFKSKQEKEHEPTLGELFGEVAGMVASGIAVIQYAEKNEGKLKGNVDAAFQKIMQHPDKIKEIAIGSGMGMVNDFLAERRARIEEKSKINQGVANAFQQFKNLITQEQAAQQHEQDTAKEAGEAMSDLDAKLGEVADFIFPWFK